MNVRKRHTIVIQTRCALTLRIRTPVDVKSDMLEMGKYVTVGLLGKRVISHMLSCFIR